MHQRNTKLIEDVKRLEEDREKTDEEKNEILGRFQQVSHTAVFESSGRLEHGIEVVRIIDKIKTYTLVCNKWTTKIGGRGGGDFLNGLHCFNKSLSMFVAQDFLPYLNLLWYI